MKKAWILLLVFAFVLRLIAALYWEARIAGPAVERQAGRAAHVSRDGPFFFGDSDSYWKLGRTIAFHRPYEFDEQRHWTVFRMPGYPVLLAPLFWIQGETPPVFSARVLNCLLGAMAVALTGLLAFLLFRKHSIAFISGLFVAIDPCMIAQSVWILSESPFFVAFLGQMILLVHLFRKVNDPENEEEGWKRLGIGLGIVTAATVYFRPSWLYFVPFTLILTLIFSLICHGKTMVLLRRLTRPILMATVVFALCLAPWWIRNAQVTGRFVPTTLQMGASLYDGLNPKANGSSDMSFIDKFRQEEKLSPSIPNVKHFEVGLDHRMKQASLTWCREHPDRVAELAVVKFIRLWNFIPNEPAFSARLPRLAIVLSYAPVLILGLLGGFYFIRRDFREKYLPGTLLLCLPAFYLTGLHLIFVSSLRYRTPAMFGIMILAAAALASTKYFKNTASFLDLP